MVIISALPTHEPEQELNEALQANSQVNLSCFSVLAQGNSC